MTMPVLLLLSSALEFRPRLILAGCQIRSRDGSESRHQSEVVDPRPVVLEHLGVKTVVVAAHLFGLAVWAILG